LAISPPSDIVLDVARAVEPDAFAAARARLASRAGMAPGAAAAAAASQPFSLGDLRNSAMARPSMQADATPQTYRKFEGMVLATFVQSMLPKQADAVYGEGMAGDMWKSLLSQQLGTAIADRGGIGIADSLLKDHYQDGDKKVALSAVSSGPEKAQHDQRLNLSAAMVQELQRRLTADIAGDTSPATDAQ
jgi:Rod binding domain-containing protein